MNARLRMYKYCYSNEGAIYAKGLCSTKTDKAVKILKREVTGIAAYVLNCSIGLASSGST